MRIGILGASGYTAFELARLLMRHPHAEITRLTSRDQQRPHISAVHPQLRGLDLHLTPFELDDFASNVDFAFSCLPHAASATIVRQIVDKGIGVVDFSADYRLDDLDLFETCYDVTHPDPERIGTVPYGLPELFRDSIRNSKLVANPGCFPTSILLAIAPLIAEGLLASTHLIADSKTGVSGAGRKTNLKFHFPECNESVAAYAVGSHRHRPEIENIGKRYTHRTTQITFTPHLIPMDRGILSTIYFPGEANHNKAAKFRETLANQYRDEPFVELVDAPPATKDVMGTNRCHLFVGEDRGQPIMLSVIDNLIKGASGAAVQNFNLMNGFDETLGLQP